MAGRRASMDTHIVSHRSLVFVATPARCEEETCHDTHSGDSTGRAHHRFGINRCAGAAHSACGTRRGRPQSQYRNGRATRRAARDREGDGGTDHRIPAEERRLQEDRRFDERQGNRREELLEAEAAHHDRCGAWGARRAVSIWWLRGRDDRPRSSRLNHRESGYTLIELLVAATLFVVVTA